jgi:hypothetical protein
MRYQKISLFILGLLFVSSQAYQMDELRRTRLSKGPIILPPPKEISYGSETAYIDPCNFEI